MEKLTDVLIRCYLFDVEVMSNHWMYIPMMIPAAAYVAFMLAKWVVLTCPVWLPLAIIVEKIPRRTVN